MSLLNTSAQNVKPAFIARIAGDGRQSAPILAEVYS